MKRKGTKDLTLTQRRKIENWLAIGATKKQIAEQLGVCLATVYNELKRGQCTQKIYTYTDYWGERHYKQVTAYSADIAEYKYRQNQSAHGAPLKIDNDFELVREIENRVINDKISPCAALGRIKREKACRTMISKTTLYRYIRAGYIFTRITMNDVQLKQRHYQKATIKRPPKGTSIEKRPAEIAARDTFGHWEMDCVEGAKGTKRTALVLTERVTRYEIVIPMRDHTAASVVDALDRLEQKYTPERFKRLFLSVTVDNGHEFMDCKGMERSAFTGDSRTTLYYCHPRCPGERGSNEKQNQLIRWFFPKGTDFTHITNKKFQQVTDWINNYPRLLLDWHTSSELFSIFMRSIA